MNIWIVTYLSYLLFKLKLSLNYISSPLFKFYFCFHSMTILPASWDDKNGTKPKNILLQFSHFTFLKQKALKNRLLLTLLSLSLRDLWFIDMVKGYSNFYHLGKTSAVIFYHFSCLCLHCSIPSSSNIMNVETALLQWFVIKFFETDLNLMVRSIRQTLQIKK